MVPGRHPLCVGSLWQHACYMGYDGTILSVTCSKNSSCPGTSAPGFKAIFGEPQRQEKESEKRRGVFPRAWPRPHALPQWTGTTATQLSQGGVAGVGVALVLESGQSWHWHRCPAAWSYWSSLGTSTCKAKQRSVSSGSPTGYPRVQSSTRFPSLQKDTTQTPQCVSVGWVRC